MQRTVRRISRVFAAAAGCLLLAGIATAAESGVDSLMAQNVTYKAHLARDPYSLPSEGNEPAKKVKAELNLETAKLVGVVMSPSGDMALIEDGSGEGYALRVGDSIKGGKVLEITKTTLKAWIRLDGLGQSVHLDLVEEGE